MIVFELANFNKDVSEEIVTYLSPKWERAVKSFTKEAKELIRESIVNSEEYHSISPGGIFYGQIGNPNIEHDLKIIIDTIINNIEIENIGLRVVGDEIEAYFEIRILKSDFSDILILPEAVYTYLSREAEEAHANNLAIFNQSHDKQMNWLRWLLIDGGGPIVTGFHYAYRSGIESWSRTGSGIMFRNGSWSLPFIGTLNDNWLTRAMDRIVYILEDIMEDEFRSELDS